MESDLQARLDALEKWVRDLFTHPGAHHSMLPPPITPAEPVKPEGTDL